jgi:hypothetical protein
LIFGSAGSSFLQLPHRRLLSKKAEEPIKSDERVLSWRTAPPCSLHPSPSGSLTFRAVGRPFATPPATEGVHPSAKKQICAAVAYKPQHSGKFSEVRVKKLTRDSLKSSLSPLFSPGAAMKHHCPNDQTNKISYRRQGHTVCP